MSENVKQSLCWKCKHGLCLKETSRELMLPAAMETQEVKEYWEEQPIKPQDLQPVVVQQEAVKAICFWRPSHIKDAPPILVANVQECNRFEERDE